MSRARRRPSLADELNLDPLLDILACSVGIMLVVVVLGLMQAQGTKATVFLPRAQPPPPDAHRVLVTCTGGRIRPLRYDAALDALATRAPTYNNVPKLVKAANRRVLGDDFFDYRFELREWSEDWRVRNRAVDLIIEERADATGFDIDTLRADPAAFVAAIRGREERDIWVAFSVNKDSLEVFREARAVLAANGIATGWEPGALEFPLRETILGGGPAVAGPVRSFGTTQ
ncbi:hypothetical protein [Haliangium ochraceum]|uniref:Uncharacterized protein n=1 Tax=Haliangium ochraceum (strain DSM 14365 / JCM 11303 / SMP-2) TaxID=502025 RepID=D0LS33_HALO1|nr:hypothetical protein [Haliangium ochraceum]ACY13730.1 hypothetical protein Hoch_1160 [Haliangium ochraceum DSM 14365]